MLYLLVMLGLLLFAPSAADAFTNTPGCVELKIIASGTVYVIRSVKNTSNTTCIYNVPDGNLPAGTVILSPFNQLPAGSLPTTNDGDCYNDPLDASKRICNIPKNVQYGNFSIQSPTGGPASFVRILGNNLKTVEFQNMVIKRVLGSPSVTEPITVRGNITLVVTADNLSSGLFQACGARGNFATDLGPNAPLATGNSIDAFCTMRYFKNNASASSTGTPTAECIGGAFPSPPGSDGTCSVKGSSGIVTSTNNFSFSLTERDNPNNTDLAVRCIDLVSGGNCQLVESVEVNTTSFLNLNDRVSLIASNSGAISDIFGQTVAFFTGQSVVGFPTPGPPTSNLEDNGSWQVVTCSIPGGPGEPPAFDASASSTADVTLDILGITRPEHAFSTGTFCGNAGLLDRKSLFDNITCQNIVAVYGPGSCPPIGTEFTAVVKGTGTVHVEKDVRVCNPNKPNQPCTVIQGNTDVTDTPWSSEIQVTRAK